MASHPDSLDSPDPFRRLVAIMARLRAPGGCPWDREQTHQTLRQYMIEEAHEACDAIDREDDRELRLELGDVALQVVFHAQIAAEEGRFTIDDVMNAICEKLIHRHPHVFGEVTVADSGEVLVNWEKLKTEEKPDSSAPSSLLDGIPKSLPALHRSQRMQEKAARVGFDWPSAEEAFPKIEEEAGELRRAMESSDSERQAEEIGDLLFSVVNFARLKGLNAEELLHSAAAKFDARFRALEARVRRQGRRLGDMTLDEMDAIWNELKTPRAPQEDR
ncbi:MAG: nucleoside triphosphate pyrophosphohydrolase [Candidatus Sumerlaeota bacterium]|nr:nucleoside triphosphate pyrophosphohydrolase [Candidatus Sumerlaeota bacterium]